jgi:hypothetical protein
MIDSVIESVIESLLESLHAAADRIFGCEPRARVGRSRGVCLPSGPVHQGAGKIKEISPCFIDRRVLSLSVS